MMLALTFGLPVIVPTGGGLAEVAKPTFARTFDPGTPGALAAALRDAHALATPAAAAAAAAAAAEMDPTVLSHQFAISLREKLDAGLRA